MKLKIYLDENNLKSRLGNNFRKGNLYTILSNKTYIGLISHKSIDYKGEHEGLIAEELFNKAQELLLKNRITEKCSIGSASTSLLAGKLFDDKGNRMSPSHSNTRNKRYRYYISQAILQFKRNEAGTVSKIPAGEIEKIVIDEIKSFLLNTKNIQPCIAHYDIHKQKELMLSAKTNFNAVFIRTILNKIILYKDKIEITLCEKQLLKALEAVAYNTMFPEELKIETESPITITKEIKIAKVSPKGSVLILNGSNNQEVNINPFLVKIIAKSYYWNKLIEEGKAKDSKDIQKLEKLSDNDYIKKALGLRILSPKIVEIIINGKQPPDLTVQKLLAVKSLDWQEQEKQLHLA